VSELSQGGKFSSAVLLALPLGILLLAYQAWAFGFCASQVWNWHIAPVGLPRLGWEPCAAVMLIVGLIRMRAPEWRGEDKREPWERGFAFVCYYAAPWAVLLVAWWLT
jgi:hypothetical protein